MKAKDIVKSVLPESLQQTVKSILGRSSMPARLKHGQQEADYYDRAFDENNGWRLHYTQSPYYIIWTVIIDRLRRRNARKVLEIGCGTGQLARAIHDAGIVEDYLGFDFSPKRLDQARLACPQFRFEIADAFKTDLIEKFEYDTVITTEFLEHVEGDVDVIRRIRGGAGILATVPNFPFISHVRHFCDTDEVAARYADLFNNLSVDSILANEKGKTFFVLEGNRKA